MDGGTSVAIHPRPHRWRWWWALPVVALMGLGLIGPDWWSPSRHDGAGASAVDQASGQVTLTARNAALATAAGPGAATILDEPSMHARDDAVGAGTGMNPSPLSASPFAGIAATTAAARAVPANAETPFVTPASPAVPRTTPATRTPTATARGPRDDGEPDLIATLLHNIQTQTGEPPSGLDTLIRKMEAAEAATTETRKRDTRAGASPRSQQIQANLRECPPANTASGLTCRQAICAVYAGRDPACPAP